MAQFDVHHNQGLQRDTMPFVVLVQSGKYDSYRGRVVVPLVRRSALGISDSTPFSKASKLGSAWPSLAKTFHSSAMSSRVVVSSSEMHR